MRPSPIISIDAALAESRRDIRVNRWGDRWLVVEDDMGGRNYRSADFRTKRGADADARRRRVRRALNYLSVPDDLAQEASYDYRKRDRRSDIALDWMVFVRDTIRQNPVLDLYQQLRVQASRVPEASVEWNEIHLWDRDEGLDVHIWIDEETGDLLARELEGVWPWDDGDTIQGYLAERRATDNWSR